MIFSGDAAYGGRPEEFARAREVFFEPLLDAAGLPADRLFLVPGNHDMDRAIYEKFAPLGLRSPLDTPDAVKDWLQDDASRQAALQPFAAYNAFVAGLTGQPSPSFASHRSFTLRDRQIALLGLNSAWMCARHRDPAGESTTMAISSSASRNYMNRYAQPADTTSASSFFIIRLTG